MKKDTRALFIIIIILLVILIIIIGFAVYWFTIRTPMLKDRCMDKSLYTEEEKRQLQEEMEDSYEKFFNKEYTPSDFNAEEYRKCLNKYDIRDE